MPATALQRVLAEVLPAATQADFLKGDVENLSIDTRGQLTLGPATELVYETPVAIPLDGGAGARRHAVRRHRQRRPGVSASIRREGSQFFDATELEIHAHGARRQTAASTPPGRPTARSTTSIATARRPRSSIRKRSTSGRWRSTRGATSTPPPVKRASSTRSRRTAKARRSTRTKATHATALAVDRAGNLLVGTESPGRVLRVDADGKGFVLLDTPYQEIRTLKFDDKGLLYVAAAERTAEQRRHALDADGRHGAVAGRTRRAPVRDGVGVDRDHRGRVVDTPSAATFAGTRAASRRRRRAPSIGSRPMACGIRSGSRATTCRTTSTFDGAAAACVVATGDKGKIYRLEGDPLRPTLLARAGAQQVTALYRGCPRQRLSTRRPIPARCSGSRRTAPRAARYESEVARRADGRRRGARSAGAERDAGGSRIEVSTRSGNTETPDDTWSPWSAPYHGCRARRSRVRRRATCSGARCLTGTRRRSRR